MLYEGHNTVEHPDGSTTKSWHAYTCVGCGRDVSGAIVAERHYGYEDVKWLQCPICGEGAVQRKDGCVYPGKVFGPVIEGLPRSVSDGYEEARNCMSVNAFTACELICRTILMYVAVEKGAKENETFVSYIDYLENKGFITPPMKEWVGLIKEHGGKAAHLLEGTDEKRAESTVMFTAELLRLVYEMDFMAKKYTKKKNGEVG